LIVVGHRAVYVTHISVGYSSIVKCVCGIGNEPDCFIEIIDSFGVIFLNSIGYTSIIIGCGESSENLVAGVNNGRAAPDGEIGGAEVSS
jgi:hypothetical protein